MNRSTPVDDLSEALACFEQAIEANPADPLAYVGLAEPYFTLGHGPAPPPDVWPKARAAAERAMRLDSTIAEVWSSMAQVKYYYEWDWEGADRAFRRANELNPSLPFNRYHHAWYLVTVGRLREALAEHHRARELDPPSSWSAMGLAELHAALGHREEALRWLEYEPRHAWWAGFLSLPVYEFLHDEPRYQALVRLVNLPNRQTG